MQPRTLASRNTSHLTFRAYRFGSDDPSVRIDSGGITMVSCTHLGPAWTMTDAAGCVTFGGPGAEVVHQRQPDPAGLNDTFRGLVPVHDIVQRLQADFGDVRIGSSADVYKASLTATLGQRITAADAARQWSRICRAFGSSLDTPGGPLLSPPTPDRLARLAPFQMHRYGIEESRSRTLIAIARIFDRPGPHLTNPGLALQRITADVPRFGPWTRALVEAEALGNPDAVAVGDFHLKNLVAHALNGRPRGSDDDMLRTLHPYIGQRGRILMWLSLAAVAPPKFGPRRRNIDVRRF